MSYFALSIVAPNAQRIVQGIKTLEVRSWQPESLPLRDLIIVENQNFLLQEGSEEKGLALALVDIESIHVWQPTEVEAACTSVWSEGYYAWVISNVRPLPEPIACWAKRKLYKIVL